jgi:hypothetical protein
VIEVSGADEERAEWAPAEPHRHTPGAIIFQTIQQQVYLHPDMFMLTFLLASYYSYRNFIVICDLPRLDPSMPTRGKNAALDIDR